MRAIKINKIEELKELSESKLENMLGLVGKAIYERARGIDRRPVTSEKAVKSIGKEHTFEKDIRDPEIIFKTFENLIHEIYQGVIEDKFSFTKSASWRTQGEKRFISSIKAITVICRFQGFETHSKSMTLKEPSNHLKILKRGAKKLLLKSIIKNQKLVRLVGLRVKIV